MLKMVSLSQNLFKRIRLTEEESDIYSADNPNLP